jgi:hypothetical protein
MNMIGTLTRVLLFDAEEGGPAARAPHDGGRAAKRVGGRCAAKPTSLARSDSAKVQSPTNSQSLQLRGSHVPSTPRRRP